MNSRLLFGRLIVLVGSVVLPAAGGIAAPPKEQNAWYWCKADDECIAARGACQQPIAINKSFERDFRAYSKALAKLIQCEAPTAESQRWAARVLPQCKSGTCDLVDPQPERPSDR